MGLEPYSFLHGLRFREMRSTASISTGSPAEIRFFIASHAFMRSHTTARDHSESEVLSRLTRLAVPFRRANIKSRKVGYMDAPVCTCQSHVCPHEGECGRKAALRLKVAVAIGEAGAFRPDFETYLCEACWDRVKPVFAKSFAAALGGKI
jgi:hypothetical protein